MTPLAPRLPIRHPQPATRHPRRGFTLVELMVVIVVVSILMALILPAIGRARITANEAKVMTEINQLASSIGAFKAKYGVEPPSSISIHLSPAGWASDPASRALIRQIWPQFDFTMGQTNPSIAAYPSYWNNIAQPNSNANNAKEMIIIHSGECLLFFLGGVMNLPGQPPVGFSKNVQYPFAPSIGAGSVTNREGPFYEFSNISQFTDVDNNGINEWKDSLPGQVNPYLYFSTYDGRGYNLAELPSNGTAYGIYPSSGSPVPCLHDFYRVSNTAVNPPAAPTFNAGVPVAVGSQLLPPQKPQTFQIISPGYDTLYGSGGVFNPNLVGSGLVDPTGAADTAQYDNLTNFNGGRLKP